MFANKLKQFDVVLVSLILVGGWGTLICPLGLELFPDNWNQVERILRMDERFLQDYKLKSTNVMLPISDNMISLISLTENRGFWSWIAQVNASRNGSASSS